MSTKIIFKFNSNEMTETFFIWWKEKIQKIFEDDSRYDNYVYKITNYEDANEIYGADCKYTIEIEEEVKSED